MEIEKIGENAGKVWHALHDGKEFSIPELSRTIDLSHEDTTLAIGWLARENKIYFQRKNGQIFVSNGNQQGLYFG
ncbi:MAG: winged helix-turn-helix domain-containing protein [Parabacteroides sp.]|nr:winged helix-turn-helix domain-containing protein [Parabacteroides sp.]